MESGNERHAGEPSPSPATWLEQSGSWGKYRRPRMATKIGTDAWAIPAMLESMCVSPQATSVIGSAALMIPSTRQGRQAARSSVTARACSRSTREVARSGARLRWRARELRHRSGRDVVDGDLDEEVRGSPHGREEEDQGPVGAHALRLAGRTNAPTRTSPAKRPTNRRRCSRVSPSRSSHRFCELEKGGSLETYCAHRLRDTCDRACRHGRRIRKARGVVDPAPHSHDGGPGSPVALG